MSIWFLQSMRVISFAMLLSSTSALADRWNDSNHPSIMDDRFIYQLNRLPLEGRLEATPWSETYWASKLGSINLRWNQPEPEGFGYESPTKLQLLRMTREQMARLSPSEKYDIFMGRYDYPLKEEVKGIATKTAKWWSGLCDGWSIATLQYLEPKAVDRMNPDGILVPFGSSDVKALMSYAAAQRFDVETRQVGARCSGIGRIFGNPSCGDINAGSLHVILANQLGIKKQGFVMERDPGPQIWNQATYGYRSQIIGSAKSEDGAYGVRIKTTILYVDELEKSSWEPVIANNKNVEGKMELDYVLDLDSAGNIIGGKFLGDQRPDFVWLPINRLEFTNDLDGINRIYEPNEPQN